MPDSYRGRSFIGYFVGALAIGLAGYAAGTVIAIRGNHPREVSVIDVNCDGEEDVVYRTANGNLGTFLKGDDGFFEVDARAVDRKSLENAFK